ncbi:MAG: hypothetical protein V4683_00705 [Bacteroidota bacterium]
MEAKYKPMFTGRETGRDLTLEQAKQKVQKFNCNRKKEDIKAHYFSEALLRKILEQKDVLGVRVYYGMDEKSDLDMVIVGVTADGENKITVPVKGEKDGGRSGYYSSAAPCPSYCPKQTSPTDK